MRMISKPYWLPKAIDVRIIDCPTPSGSGFCTIQSIDFYEDIQEIDGEELARFSDVYEAFEWLATKGYNAVDPGCADGVYRHRDSAEWMYAQIDKKPVRVIKRAKEKKILTPMQERLLLMMAA